MPDFLITVLFALALAVLIGAMLWSDKRWPRRNDQQPRRAVDRPALCAYCIYRNGEDCTNPQSHVYGASIGRVCSGNYKCRVRQIRPPGRSPAGPPYE